ncbi:hypothetical protein [Bacillus sp. FJAT-52991]|uniref:Uncharacterized protein n=1 Tax=Bacillus kandeliae TaxID=3129297 RepID=A0ABZ2N629_9BACI
MQEESLYTPSLSEGTARQTESYNVGSLFIVAFFGGVFAITVLGLRNAKWLLIEKKYLQWLVAASVIALLFKLSIVYAVSDGMMEGSDAFIRVLGKGIGLLLYFIYYFVLKRAFHDHLALGGEVQPLLRDGIIWVVISMFVEGGLLLLLI